MAIEFEMRPLESEINFETLIGESSPSGDTQFALATGREQTGVSTFKKSDVTHINIKDEDIVFSDSEPLTESESMAENADPERDNRIAAGLIEKEIRDFHGKQADKVLDVVDEITLTERNSPDCVIGPDLQKALAKDIATGKYTQQFRMNFAGGTLPVIPAGENGYRLLGDPVAAALANPHTPAEIKEAALRLNRRATNAYLLQRQPTRDQNGNPINLQETGDKSPIYSDGDNAPIIEQDSTLSDTLRHLLQTGRTSFLNIGAVPGQAQTDVQQITKGAKIVLSALEENDGNTIAKNGDIQTILQVVKETFADANHEDPNKDRSATKEYVVVTANQVIEEANRPSDVERVMGPLLSHKNYDAVRGILIGTDESAGMEQNPLPANSTARLQELHPHHPGASVISRVLSFSDSGIQLNEVNVIAASMVKQVENSLHTIQDPQRRAQAEQWVQDVRAAYPTNNRRLGNSSMAPNIQQEATFASKSQQNDRVLVSHGFFGKALDRSKEKDLGITKEWYSEMIDTTPFQEMAGQYGVVYNYADAGLLHTATNQTEQGTQLLDTAAENMSHVLQNVGLTVQADTLKGAASYNEMLTKASQQIAAHGLDPSSILEQAAKARTIDELRGVPPTEVANFTQLFVVNEPKDTGEKKSTNTAPLPDTVQYQHIQDGLTFWQGAQKAQTPSMKSTAERRRRQIEQKKEELREKYPTLDAAVTHMKAVGVIPPFGGPNGEPHVSEQFVRYAMSSLVGNAPVRGYIAGGTGTGKTYMMQEVLNYTTQVKNEQRGIIAYDANGNEIPLGNTTVVMAPDASYGAYVGEKTTDNLGRWFTELLDKGVPMSTINRLSESAQRGYIVDELDKLMESDQNFAEAVNQVSRNSDVKEFSKGLLNSFLGVADTNRPVSVNFNKGDRRITRSTSTNNIDLVFSGSLGPQTDTVLAHMRDFGKLRRRVAGDTSVRIDRIDKEVLETIFAGNAELINRLDWVGAMPTYDTNQIMEFGYGPNGTIGKIISTVEQRSRDLGRPVSNVILAGRDKVDEVLRNHFDTHGPNEQLRVLDKVVKENIKVPLIEAIDRAYSVENPYISYEELNDGSRAAVIHPGVITGPLTGDYMSGVSMDDVSDSIRGGQNFISKTGWQKHVKRVWGDPKKK